MADPRLIPNCAVIFDGMSWPSVHSACLASWVARYEPQRLTSNQAMKLATVESANSALLYKTQRERNRICKVITEACRVEPCEHCTESYGYSPARAAQEPK